MSLMRFSHGAGANLVPFQTLSVRSLQELEYPG